MLGREEESDFLLLNEGAPTVNPLTIDEEDVVLLEGISSYLKDDFNKELTKAFNTRDDVQVVEENSHSKKRKRNDDQSVDALVEDYKKELKRLHDRNEELKDKLNLSEQKVDYLTSYNYQLAQDNNRLRQALNGIYLKYNNDYYFGVRQIYTATAIVTEQNKKIEELQQKLHAQESNETNAEKLQQDEKISQPETTASSVTDSQPISQSSVSLAAFPLRFQYEGEGQQPVKNSLLPGINQSPVQTNRPF